MKEPFDNLNYVENLLKNYHQFNKKINYLKEIMKSQSYGTLSDTIEELNYKDQGFLHEGRGP